MERVLFDHVKVMRAAEKRRIKSCLVVGCGDDSDGVICEKCIEKFGEAGIDSGGEALYSYYKQEITNADEEFVSSAKKKSLMYLQSLKK